MRAANDVNLSLFSSLKCGAFRKAGVSCCVYPRSQGIGGGQPPPIIIIKNAIPYWDYIWVWYWDFYNFN